MKKFILSALVFSLQVSANSTLQICNTLVDSAIYVSMLRQVGAGAGWQSRGWYKVDAKSCFDFNLGNYLGKLYLYAEDERKESRWGSGNTQFCVHKTDAFSYANADTIACSDVNQKRVPSDEIDIADGINHWTISPNLTRLSLCNENSFAIYSSVAKRVNNSLEASGWYRIEPNSCRAHTVGQYTGPIYTYAEYNLGALSWGNGPVEFCVNQTTAFKYSNAESTADCDPASSKMIDSTETQVTAGTTKIVFEPQTLKTTLRMCNNTVDKTLAAAYAIAQSANSVSSTGWFSLKPKECTNVDLDTYAGEAYLYAETAGGEEYWGSGPTNICVNRNTNFIIADSTNAAACNSTIQQKMVPTFKMDVKEGTNTFNFN